MKYAVTYQSKPGGKWKLFKVSHSRSDAKEAADALVWASGGDFRTRIRAHKPTQPHPATQEEIK